MSYRASGAPTPFDYPETFRYDRLADDFIAPDGTHYSKNDPAMWDAYDKEIAEEDALAEKVAAEWAAENAAADAAWDAAHKKPTTVPEAEPTAGQHPHDEDGAAHIHDYVPVHQDVDRHFSRGTAPAHIPIATIEADIADSAK